MVTTVQQAPDELGRLEKRHEFIELRAKGYSYDKIARRLKVSKSTISRWNTELEADVVSLKAMELDALYERYYMLKQGRIKLLGGHLRKLQTEIKKRDLRKLSTKELYDLLLKLYEVLMAEYTDVRPLSEDEIAMLQGGEY